MNFSLSVMLVSILLPSASALRLPPNTESTFNDGDTGLITISEYFSATTGNDGKNFAHVLEQNKVFPEALKKDLCLQKTPIKGTMKQPNKYLTLLTLVQNLTSVPGDILMAGIAEGGDAYGVLFYLACKSDLRNRQIHVFDTWKGLPPAMDKDDKGFKTGEYHKTYEAFIENGVNYGKIYDRVMVDKQHSWKEVMAHLVTYKGLFADTMPGAASEKTVAFLSCDGDMYQSTLDCLNSAADHMAPGSPIYQDDYYTFIGNYKAVQDFRSKKHISNDVAPIFIIPRSGTHAPYIEDAAFCVPPTSNYRGNAGKCSKVVCEGAYWRTPN